MGKLYQTCPFYAGLSGDERRRFHCQRVFSASSAAIAKAAEKSLSASRVNRGPAGRMPWDGKAGFSRECSSLHIHNLFMYFATCTDSRRETI